MSSFPSASRTPVFTSIPSDPGISYGDDLGVDFDATDPNLDTFGVNDTRFTINNNWYP